MTAYNVLDEKWMPVNDVSGAVKYISPFDLFNSPSSYVGFAGDPVENYSMLRFCCVLSQSSKQSQAVSVGQLNAFQPTSYKN